MSLVTRRQVDEIAVIEINSPPVNALSAQLRKELIDTLQQTIEDKEAKCILLHCQGSTFICGADIREFDVDPIAPHLPELIHLLETSPIPTVALLHGHVLGGGLEVAAACHYRIALSGTYVGLPEVNLGVVPGAGGCQRLMRLIGVEKAVTLATSGRPVEVSKDAVDKLCEQIIAPSESLLDKGVAWCRDQIENDALSPRPTAEQDLMAAEVDWEKIAASIKKISRKNPTPQLLFNQLQADWRLDVKAGEQNTRQLFLKLRQSETAKGLRHAFFVERKMQSGTTKPNLEIRCVGIIGAGTMGRGIAMVFADAGIQVTLIEQTQVALENGLEGIEQSYQAMVTAGRLTESQSAERIRLISGACDYQALATADLVVEAAFESLAVKVEIFQTLDQVCKASAILATNTSYLDINQIAAATHRPNKVVGLHFFSPANVMKLLEIVKAAETDDDVMAQMKFLSKRLKKQAVSVGVCFGFAANRMYTRYGREIQQMLLEGASVQLIDSAMRAFGMAMGPLAVQDLSGIDIGHHARSQYPHPEDDPGYFQVSAALVRAGRLGRKTKAGFYDYSEGKGSDDEGVAHLIKETAQQLAIQPQVFTTESIQQRALLAMLSEAATIVEESIVDSVEAIDLIWLHGYGFPRAKGGPIHWLKQQSENEITDKLVQLQQQNNSRLWPRTDLMAFFIDEPSASVH